MKTPSKGTVPPAAAPTISINPLARGMTGEPVHIKLVVPLLEPSKLIGYALTPWLL
jgi:hypothetical protein